MASSSSLALAREHNATIHNTVSHRVHVFNSNLLFQGIYILEYLYPRVCDLNSNVNLVTQPGLVQEF